MLNVLSMVVYVRPAFFFNNLMHCIAGQSNHPAHIPGMSCWCDAG